MHSMNVVSVCISRRFWLLEMLHASMQRWRRRRGAVRKGECVLRSEKKPFHLVPWTAGVGAGRAFGTFGELLQGQVGKASTDFLVTLPIDQYSYALVVDSFLVGGNVADSYLNPDKKILHIVPDLVSPKRLHGE